MALSLQNKLREKSYTIVAEIVNWQEWPIKKKHFKF